MFRLMCPLLFLLVVLPLVSSTDAQTQETWIPSTFEPGASINLFTQWQGIPSEDGFLVVIPVGWEFNEAIAVRQSYSHINLDVKRLSEGEFLLSSPRTLGGNYDLILKVTTDSGNIFEPQDVSIAPAIKSGATYLQHQGYLRYGQLQARDNFDYGRILAFDGQTSPLHLQSQWLERLNEGHTLEWWIQTTTLNAVVLSTWDGSDTTPYPMEFVLDARGRMRYYRKTLGHHVTLVTPFPVADGNWHHIALVNNPETNWTKLYLDGLIADSLLDPSATQFNDPQSLAIGGCDGLKRGSLSQNFSGNLDNIRLWNSVRNVTQIQASMGHSIEASEMIQLDFESMESARYLQESNIREYLDAGGPVSEPLEYNFRGIVFDEGVMLSWRNTISIASSFLIERSEDGQIFEELARINKSIDTDQWSYTDFTPPDQIVFYRLIENSPGRASQLAGTIKLGLATEAAPPAVEIIGNYPNPFNPRTVISYEVREPQPLMLSIVNISGLEIAILSDRFHESGIFEAFWDGTELPSGTYFIRLQGRDGTVHTRQILLAK